MQTPSWLKLLVILAGFTAAGSGRAQNALAEEIWSQNFCEQAVSLAQRHGESPQALNMGDCRLLNYYQPSYWQCVIATLNADTALKLDAARSHCLAQY